MERAAAFRTGHFTTALRRITAHIDREQQRLAQAGTCPICDHYLLFNTTILFAAFLEFVWNIFFFSFD
jgi:hypothetical protein